MIKLYIYAIFVNISFLAVTSYAQGVRVDSEEYLDGGSIGGFNSEQNEVYSQDMQGILDKLSIKNSIQRSEQYINFGSEYIDNSIMELDSKETTLRGLSDYSPRTSLEYAADYKKTLDEKTKMVGRQQKEIEELGDTAKLRTKHFRELMKLTEKSNKISDLESLTYKKERLKIAKQEALEFEEDNAISVDRYGVKLSGVVKYQRIYNRLKNDIKNLKKRQLKEKTSSANSFDLNSKQTIERGRIDREFRKAREDLDKAKRLEREKKKRSPY